MKQSYYLVLMATLLMASCKTEDRVIKITFDNNTHASTYQGEKTNNDKIEETSIKKNDAFVTEGSDIQILVTNFNPLRYVFTLQQDNDALFYTSGGSQTNALTSFLGASNTAQIINPNPNPQNKGIAKKNPNQAKCLIIKGLNSKENTLLSTIDKFYKFYNAIVALNNKIDNYNKPTTLDKTAFYCDLDNTVNKIRSNYKDGTDITSIACAGKPADYAFANFAEGNNFILEKDIYVRDIQEKITDIENDITKDKATTGDCVEKDVILSSSIQQSINKAKLLKEEINTKLTSNIDLVANKLNAISKLQFTFNPSMPHVGETDELVLKLSVTDKVDNNTLVYNLAHLPVRKAIKIDYSAGAFFTGLYDESFTKTVSTVTDNTVDPPVNTPQYTLHEFDGGGLSYGAMAFINFHSQLPHDFNYGLSLGGGLRFNQTTKFVLCPTASLFIGKYQRLIVHLGYALSQVDRIYSMYGNEPFTDSTYSPDVKQVVKGNFLFGISWNLSRTK